MPFSSISRWLPLVLATLSAIGPFAIDTYLPAFPAIGTSLGATQVEVQQTLTVYMLTFAVMVMWHGSLSDRFGRRRVLIVASGAFAFASALCALAPTIEWLWIGRAAQGVFGGAGVVVGRAVVRDLYDGAQAQRLMARVMTIFAVAPAVAPMIGGVLLELAGWRAIFVFLALFGGLQTWLTWRFLPESLPEDARQPLHPVGLARAYGTVLSNPAFLLLSLATALNFNGFFLYVMSAPVFIIDHLGLGSTAFGWLFVPGVAGMMAGSMLAGRLAGRWSTGRTIAVGYALMLAAGLLNVALSALLPAGLPQSVLPIPLFTLGMAMAMPSLSLLALDLFPARRGMASSCQSFLQMGLNAAVAGAVVPLLWGSTLSLAAGMCLFAGLGLFAFLAWARRAAA
ncbi:MAG: multidrug effflux MFS transporter [Thauera phenolivorans]|uniref:Bcr/CflA family efflux transporter n=2 Tax=Thauera phenolivorans TaxID=1792543 RepID=A0A7X7LUZ9_9RHOO|nr:multidrug effflux MFS transporter [Thauera phenolivorans]